MIYRKEKYMKITKKSGEYPRFVPQPSKINFVGEDQKRMPFNVI